MALKSVVAANSDPTAEVEVVFFPLEPHFVIYFCCFLHCVITLLLSDRRSFWISSLSLFLS